LSYVGERFLFTVSTIQNQEAIDCAALLDRVAESSGPVEVVGLAGSERAHVLSRMVSRLGGPILVVVPSSAEADQLAEDIAFFSPSAQHVVDGFPPYHLMPFKFLSYHNQTASERIRVLYQLMVGASAPLILAPVTALLQQLIPRAELSRYAELIMEGEEVDRGRLVAKLITGGYLRAAIVEEPGDFSVRGGIVDVYSPLYADPLRIEFFGDRVESLRFFSAVDQRKLQPTKEAVVLPAREAILHPEQLAEITQRMRLRAAQINLPATQMRRIATQLSHQENVPGIESLLPLIYPHLDHFVDYLPPNTRVVIVDPDRLQQAAREFEEQVRANDTACLESGRLCVPPEALYFSWGKVRGMLSPKRVLSFRQLDVRCADENDDPSNPLLLHAAVRTNHELTAALRQPRGKEDLLQPLADWVQRQRSEGRLVAIACQAKTQAKRLASLLAPYGLRFIPSDGFPVEGAEPGAAFICLGRLTAGFVWPAEGLAVLSENEIFGVRQIRRATPAAKARARLLGLRELKQGDLIVHDEHGIGQYDGLQKLTVERVRNEFLVIIYQGGDKLYLPVDRMGVVQKYMGVEGLKPALDRLGGKSWERVKARVKRSAEKIAGELLRLYAQRKVAIGTAFDAADDSFQDFETGFAYEETADQIKAIEEVLSDMREPTPMDRLVCGDVGYGKTEVALRAAFLAVSHGKQVAVLVPTTILAEQHGATFRSRFQRYPVNIACLSRFRSRSDQAAILEGLKSGAIDIVVGTHRLLQKDVAFKDLGLLVLDEEQRFGVRHKERLKRLRASVDVLALTATPIPRTLHLSLAGVRDISLIQTPPEYRKAIITAISEFDPAVIAEAIRRELKRQGQVFFVHNSINDIHEMAAMIQGLVPEVRLDVAHGRMPEEELERVMARFMDRQIDLLVCTTIIESGLDIATANTMIVNRADCFGLAQMYQLRGRVGRSDEQAYAYLLIPDESGLTADARKRLKVLMEHSDLGAGFQIAMNDLEIRGGGTILGASQSGHIAAVGYDMFLQLMEEAMSELKGQPVPPPLDPEVNIPLSAFFPEGYIPEIDQRMAIYRRLARAEDLQEIADVRSEITDRFGPPPDEAAHLLFKIMLKVLARNAGVSRLDLKEQRLVVWFSTAHQKTPEALVDMIVAEPKKFELTPDHVLKVRLAPAGTVGQLSQAKNILQAIGQHVNSQEN
jgi:transcription-repair coupling factor (superfamily II helicase)